MHRPHLPRGLAALALVALTAGAAAAQGDRPAKLLSERPAPRRECRIGNRPDPLPSIGQLADSASLAAAVEQFGAEHRVRDGKTFGLFSVAFAADGTVERVATVDYWLPRGADARLQAMLRGVLRRQARGGFSVRVRIEPDGTPVFRVGYSETCPPELGSRFELASPAMTNAGSLRPVRLELFVDSAGRVGDIRVASTSGNEDIDRWVVENVTRWTFGPGLVDEQVVGMQHVHVVRVRSRGGPASNLPRD